MNYNDRCTLLFPGELIDDPLEGKIPGKPKEVIYPCSKDSISNEEQIGVFGKYNQEAFKLHFQGTIKKPFDIKFQSDTKRTIHLVKYPRNSTVVIVS